MNQYRDRIKQLRGEGLSCWVISKKLRVPRAELTAFVQELERSHKTAAQALTSDHHEALEELNARIERLRDNNLRLIAQRDEAAHEAAQELERVTTSYVARIEELEHQLKEALANGSPKPTRPQPAPPEQADDGWSIWMEYKDAARALSVSTPTFTNWAKRGVRTNGKAVERRLALPHEQVTRNHKYMTRYEL